MPTRHLVARGALITGLFVAVTGSLLAVNPLPAGAHAIIELQGSIAIAGQTSAMNLEVQHGCISGGGGTVKVVAKFGAAFGEVTAGAVNGWASRVTTITTTTTTVNGQTVTWNTTGAAQQFSTPLFLPLTVRWPQRSGAYGIVVSQTCSNPSDKTIWNTPAQPATLGVPSPPMTPLPTVCVLPPRLAGPSTPQTQREIALLCATLRSPHRWPLR